MTFSEIEKIFKSDKDRLYRALLVATGDPYRAREVLSETFAQSLAGAEQIRDSRAWIWSTAFRLVGRGFGRPPSREVVLHALYENHRGAEVSPAVELIDLLRDLSEQQRKVMALRYLTNMTAVEIAEVLDSTAGSVRVQLHRAHAAIRESLKTEMEQE